ncbi:TPA_asm: coat protein [ssRNA phage Gerhypos.2_34]|uniref:Coat protein n=2 Tax=Fiersviridae TaxID=2842319 RepID=A0A8S5KXF6_9VIRU|nr:coat protein [ssRNA phage Gerhypos.2_34]QDH91447.1 MAG: hypothetical protein H2Bulk3625e142_000003 [Leviviridae sp.]DAD50366.1 TPA_asm: coat protein [ssRNA phage Gerhypos.2_34]
MPAFGDVKVSSILSATALTTSATVGVDATYSPIGYVTPGVARWEDQSSGVSVGFPSFTMSVRPPTKGSRVYKVTAKLSLPTLEAISGTNVGGFTPAQQKAYECQAIVDFLLPERSTSAERAKLLNQLASMFFTTVNASDGSPTDATGSPLLSAVTSYSRPF